MNLVQRPVPRRRTTRLWVRLALAFGALQALLVIVVVLAVMQFRDLAAHSERAMQHDVQRMLRVQEIHQHAQGHGRAMARLLTSPRHEREMIYPEVDAEHAAIDTLLHELSQPEPDADMVRRLNDIVDLRRRYREVFVEVVEWIEAGHVSRASALYHGSGEPALRALIDASHTLLAQEQLAAFTRQRAVQEEIRHSEWLLAVLAMAAVALSVVLAWRTTASVAKPLRRIETTARRIADGDYAARAEVRAGDELSQVARAMNAMATAVASREAEIERVAYVDRLTGLPNRTTLLHAHEGEGRDQAVILLDVARLRTVNEVLGFDTGDALLVRIANRLREAVPDGTLVARMAGGVFAMLCRGLDRARVEALRERIDAALTAPVDCDGHAVDVMLVYGLAEAGEEAASVDTLLRRAEHALGEAKRTKQTWVWAVPVDEDLRARQLNLLSELRSAAASGQLQMWLQPKQCLRTSAITGMEALVRWQHPQRGFISPAEFIPFAERAGHIGVVTRAMLDAALATLSRWQHRPSTPSIAVNVSTLDVRDASFVERLGQMARAHGAPLHRLRLEITESSLMDDADRVLPVLRALRELGVQLSIDDFGTGYSSLAYLQRLPVTELKIDRSFVAGADHRPEARVLLRSIVELGHSLEMSITAEGVERPQELALLRELGCDLVQGYLIGRPMTLDAAEQTLTEHGTAFA